MNTPRRSSPPLRSPDQRRGDPDKHNGTFVGMPAFPVAARAALGDTQLRRNLAHATQIIRDKRASVA